MRVLRPLWLAGLMFFALLTCAAGDNVQRVRFREVETLLANPGQGWMSQQRNPNGGTGFPCSVAYIRFDWADVEPQEGQFNWRFIDDVITAWNPHGAAVAMRVMTANAHSGGYYSSPKWLFDAGCKGFEYNAGGGDPTSGGRAIPRIEPDYADPIYLAKHGTFIAALGKRYDGNPGVEFLDIGSYGIWGEWHSTHPAPVAVRKLIVDMYLQAFPKTPLVFMSDDVEVMGYALAHGVGNINVERKIKIRQEHSIVSLFTWNERDRKSTNTILRRIVLRSRLTMGMVISGFYFPISESAN